MEPKLEGQVTLTFIRGGISKNGNPYLQCSNGRSEFFLNIPKNLSITENTFSEYEEDDIITLEVSALVGTDSVKLLGVLD